MWHNYVLYFIVLYQSIKLWYDSIYGRLKSSIRQRITHNLIDIFLVLAASLIIDVFCASVTFVARLSKRNRPQNFERVGKPRGRNVKYLFHGNATHVPVVKSAGDRTGERTPPFFLFARTPDSRHKGRHFILRAGMSYSRRILRANTPFFVRSQNTSRCRDRRIWLLNITRPRADIVSSKYMQLQITSVKILKHFCFADEKYYRAPVYLRSDNLDRLTHCI